ncbi:MAG: hypothetical protein KAR23_04415, partial [Candidatus Aenigmarchaeota archaeon]|nr:hypothetical protein [Candidatus Aenigmarchaeota archaeon]
MGDSVDSILYQDFKILIEDNILYQKPEELIRTYNRKRKKETRRDTIENALLVLNDLRIIKGDIEKIVKTYDVGVLECLESFGLVDNIDYKGILTDALVVRTRDETVNPNHLINNIPFDQIKELDLLAPDMKSLKKHQTGVYYDFLKRIIDEVPAREIKQHGLLKTNMPALETYQKRTGFKIPKAQMIGQDSSAWVSPKPKA